MRNDKAIRSTLETQGTTRIANYKTKTQIKSKREQKLKQPTNKVVPKYTNKVSKCPVNISALGVQNVMVYARRRRNCMCGLGWKGIHSHIRTKISIYGRYGKANYTTVNKILYGVT